LIKHGVNSFTTDNPSPFYKLRLRRKLRLKHKHRLTSFSSNSTVGTLSTLHLLPRVNNTINLARFPPSSSLLAFSFVVFSLLACNRLFLCGHFQSTGSQESQKSASESHRIFHHLGMRKRGEKSKPTCSLLHHLARLAPEISKRLEWTIYLLHS